MKYVVGNLTKANEDIIAHGCNAQGVMGSGVAKAIRWVFPKAYSDYLKSHEYSKPKLGDVVWSYCPGGELVANCITQEFFGRDGKRYADYDAVRTCMRNVYAECYYGKHRSVAIPKIGAGLGGGEWSIIEKIVDEELTEKGIDVVCYVLSESEIPTK